MSRLWNLKSLWLHWRNTSDSITIYEDWGPSHPAVNTNIPKKISQLFNILDKYNCSENLHINLTDAGWRFFTNYNIDQLSQEMNGNHCQYADMIYIMK